MLYILLLSLPSIPTKKYLIKAIKDIFYISSLEHKFGRPVGNNVIILLFPIKVIRPF